MFLCLKTKSKMVECIALLVLFYFTTLLLPCGGLSTIRARSSINYCDTFEMVQRTRGVTYRAPTQRRLMEMPTESNRPKISVVSLEEYLDKRTIPAATRDSSPKSSLNTTKLFGSLTLEELRMNDSKISTERAKGKSTSDENSVNPVTCFAFSAVAAAMSYGGWISTNYMVGHFAVKFLQSDFYPAQRAAIAARNIIVGVFMLFAGFSGAIAVGLLLLGASVTLQKMQRAGNRSEEPRSSG